MPSDTFTIAAGADDGYADTDGSDYTNSSNLVLLGATNIGKHLWLRYDNVTIPAGAEITDAFIRFTAFATQSPNTVNINCYFEDADDPAAPTSGSDLIGRSVTSAVAWNAIGSWTDGTTYDSPDISSILQDVIDRSGWASGQAIQAHFIDNGSTSFVNRQGSSYDFSSGEAAVLHVTYEQYTAQETIAVTESIQALKSVEDISASPEIIAVTENINLQLFQAWLEASPSGDNLAITENIAVELETFIEPSISDDIAVIENISAGLLQNVSFTQRVGVEEFVKTALDIPTNWVALANAGLTKERFYLTLTGDADGTTDIEIPVESFQARKRTDEATYLSCVVSDYAGYSAAIADRPNGEIYIEMNYEYGDEVSIRQEIVRADLEDIRTYEGPFNRSIILTGHKTTTFANRSVTLENAIYRALIEGRRTFRFAKVDPYLNPGDTLTVGAESMTVDYIIYIISTVTKSMEVKET